MNLDLTQADLSEVESKKNWTPEKQVWIIFTIWVTLNTVAYFLFGSIGILVSNLVVGIPLSLLIMWR